MRYVMEWRNANGEKRTRVFDSLESAIHACERKTANTHSACFLSVYKPYYEFGDFSVESYDFLETLVFSDGAVLVD